MERGRPALTRARVLTYIRKHQPTSIMQIVRATGADRQHIRRIMKQLRMKGKTMVCEDLKRRFDEKTDKTPGLGPFGDCWEWTGGIDDGGYARGLIVNGKSIRGTHLSLMLDGQPRPGPQMIALHSCDHKCCVNPAHLRWGTDAENALDHRERGQRGKHWLPDDIVREILSSPESNTAIAQKIGITPSAICNIRKGRSHRHIFEEFYPSS